jgi:hypothetical protein
MAARKLGVRRGSDVIVEALPHLRIRCGRIAESQTPSAGSKQAPFEVEGHRTKR